MTELHDFMQKCNERGGMSLNDHLSLGGYHADYAKRKSMEAQVTRALLDHSDYKKLLGTIIFPSVSTRGAWANGVERREDMVPRPSFTTSLVLQENIGPILAKDDWRFQATEPAIRGAMKAVATSSVRRQEDVARGFVRQNDEVDYWREKYAAAQKDVNERDHRITFLETNNSTLLSLLSRQNGLVPSDDKTGR